MHTFFVLFLQTSCISADNYKHNMLKGMTFNHILKQTLVLLWFFIYVDTKHLLFGGYCADNNLLYLEYFLKERR